jgi:hypothetical protein
MFNSVATNSNIKPAAGVPVSNAPVSRWAALAQQVKNIFFGTIQFIRELFMLATNGPLILYRRLFPLPPTTRTNNNFEEEVEPGDSSSAATTPSSTSNPVPSSPNQRASSEIATLPGGVPSPIYAAPLETSYKPKTSEEEKPPTAETVDNMGLETFR